MEIVYKMWSSLEKEVEGWQFLELSDGSRLYYSIHDGERKNGFEFKQIALVSYTAGEAWVDKNADCELLLHGTAYFDGIRHLHFGDEESSNLGYFYYPNLSKIAEVINILEEMVKHYCSDWD